MRWPRAAALAATTVGVAAGVFLVSDREVSDRENQVLSKANSRGDFFDFFFEFLVCKFWFSSGLISKILV